MTPLGCRITINRTIGIKTPPRAKKPQLLARSAKTRKPHLKEVSAMSKIYPDTEAGASEPKRRLSGEENPPKKKKTAKLSSLGSKNRLIKLKTRELKAQRRRDKYQELFLRQQALALERLARHSTASETREKGEEKEVEKEMEEENKEEEIDEKKEEEEKIVEKMEKKRKKMKEKEEIKSKNAEQEIQEKEEERFGYMKKEQEEAGEQLAAVSDLLESSMSKSEPTVEPRISPSESGEVVITDHLEVFGTSDAEACSERVDLQQAEEVVEICQKSPNNPSVTDTVSHSERGVNEDPRMEAVAATTKRPLAVRRKSSARPPRVVRPLSEKAYSVRILTPGKNKLTSVDPSPARCPFADIHRDDRDLAAILNEPAESKSAVDDPKLCASGSTRVGEPTFEEPDPNLFAQSPELAGLVSRMRRQSRLARQRNAVLARLANILTKKCYWSERNAAAVDKRSDWSASDRAGEEKGARSKFSIILGPDQIRSV